ncbi:hypothetical protein HQ531_03585 [bacterium]|nr:hypothetical protein [bacterium]
MDHAEQILAEIKDMNGKVTDIQLKHGDLAARNDEQHKNQDEKIALLVEARGDQETRLRGLEHFRTVILTKIKVIPLTISTIIGIATTLITLYLRAG